MVARLYSRHGGTEDAVFDELTGVAPFFDDNTPLIELGTSCQNGGASQGKFLVTDPESSYLTDHGVWLPAHTLIRWTEDAPGCEYWLSQGRVSGEDMGRGDTVGGDFVEHDVTVDDCNVELRGLGFTEDWVRPEETDYERLVALQAYILNSTSSTSPTLRPSTRITISDGHLAPDANTVTMPAKTYPVGTQPQEVVEDCATTAGKIFGVVIHHGSGDPLPETQIKFYRANDGGDNINWSGVLGNQGGGANGSSYYYFNAHSNPFIQNPTNPIAAGDQLHLTGYSRHECESLKINWYDIASGSDATLNGHIISSDYMYHGSADGGTNHGGTWTAWDSGVLIAPVGAMSWGFTKTSHLGCIGQDFDEIRVTEIATDDACSHLCLFYTLEDDHTTYATPVKISDQLENWDPLNLTAPVFVPEWDQGKGNVASGQAVISGLVSRYGQGEDFVYVNNSFHEDNYEVWIDGYNDSDSADAAQAAARAQAILDYRRLGDFTYRVTVEVLAEQTHLLTSGMSLQIDTAVAVGGPFRGEYTNQRIVGLNWEPLPDGRYKAHMQLNRGLRHQPPSRGKLQPAATTPTSATKLPYDGGTAAGGSGSGLVGGTVGTTQDAIDELDERVDDLEAGSTSAVTVAEVLASHRFPIAAHRGDIGSADSYPEDSLEAIRQAALKGVDIVEWDACQSSDGTFWGSHDTTVDRCTSASGAISGKTDATLAGYVYNAGFGYDAGRHGSSIGLSTLADVLEAIEQYGCLLTIELKGGSPADLAAEIVAAGWGARTIIEVSSLADAATVKGVDPNLTTLVNQSVSGSGTDANVDWLSWDSASLATLASAQAKAPKVIKAYQSITDYGTSEATPFANAWAYGARSYQANNLDQVLSLYAALFYGSAGALDDLSDVTIISPSTDEVLTYDGSGWVNAAPTAASGSHWEVLMTDGIANPPDPVLNEDGTDWLYGEVT